MKALKAIKAIKTINKVVSLAPFAMAVGVPVGRYIFGKVLEKQKSPKKKPDIYKD